MIFFLVGIVIVAYVYQKLIKPLSYWKDRGVPYAKSYPLVGATIDLILRRKHFADVVDTVYKDYPNDRYVGMQQFNTQTLLIRDVNLVKQIGVKEFDSFPDHNTLAADPAQEPLMARNLIALKGDEWRKMRATLSPVFTSSKMKTMYVLMANCARDFVKHFRGRSAESDGVIPVEMKDVLSRYANDVIATTAFGIRVDSLEEPKNEFYTMGRNITTFDGLVQFIRVLFQRFFPKIAKMLGMRFLPQDASDFFTSIVKETVAKRESEHIFRPDLINLLMEARKGKLKNDQIASSLPEKDDGFAAVEESHIGKDESVRETAMSEDDMVAQALIFFFAGFDTVSTASSFAAYELAVNPDVQKRLQNEIDAVRAKFPEDNVPYDAIMSLKYLDQVISEVLRFWTPAFMTDRKCEKEFVIKAEKAGERDLVVEKGMMMMIPIMSIQRDERYYENADRFDPDRFSDENKSKINRDAYLPFGLGPRNCIGSRFALLEVKTLFFNLLGSFDIVPVKKTTIPLKLDPKSVVMIPREGISLGFKPRKVTTL